MWKSFFYSFMAIDKCLANERRQYEINDSITSFNEYFPIFDSLSHSCAVLEANKTSWTRYEEWCSHGVTWTIPWRHNIQTKMSPWNINTALPNLYCTDVRRNIHFWSYQVIKTYEKRFFRTLRRFNDVLHVYMNFHAHELELYIYILKCRDLSGNWIE